MTATATTDNRRWWALGLLAAAQFMVIMDTSIIGVALPDIQDALGFSQSGLSWIFNAYVVAFGGLLLLGGRLSDLLGPRRVFIAGWAILTGASVLAGGRRPGEGRDRHLRPTSRPSVVISSACISSPFSGAASRTHSRTCWSTRTRATWSRAACAALICCSTSMQ